MEFPIRHSNAARISVRIAAVMAAASFFGASAPVLASSTADQVPTFAVTYSAADLATDQGARDLYQRIAKAARSVCPDYDGRDLETAELSWACQRRAIADAVRQINDPRLAAIQALHPEHG